MKFGSGLLPAVLVSLITYALATEERFLYALIALIAAYIFFEVYLLPTYIAAHRNHPQIKPILVLNIVGGWSFILWIAALVWSLYSFEDISAPGEQTDQIL